MSHIDLKPRGIKPPLDLLPLGPLVAISACYPEASLINDHCLEELPYGALCAGVSALHDGATKYARWNWLERTPDDREVYVAAALRHTAAYNDTEHSNFASDSNVHHLANAFATVVILMEKLQIEFALPTDAFDPELDGSIMFQLLAFAHPDTPDIDPAYGLHRLAIAGFLILRELELEGIGYHESVAVQAAKAGKTAGAEIDQLVREQAQDNHLLEFATNGVAPLINPTPQPEFGDMRRPMGFGGGR